MHLHDKIVCYRIWAFTLPLILLPYRVSSSGQEVPGGQVLKQVADIPMPGPAVRFDYQSLDAEHGRLYIA